jgi:hypothetical protein
MKLFCAGQSAQFTLTETNKLTVFDLQSTQKIIVDMLMVKICWRLYAQFLYVMEWPNVVCDSG